MTAKNVIPLLLLALSAGCTSCSHANGSEEQLTEYCDSFATYYYNWHFGEAMRFCTPSSEQWLRFAATGATQEDVDALRTKESDASIEIGDVEILPDDTSAVVKLTVRDFLQMDSIGQPAHLVKEATVKLPMVLHEGIWKVRMEGLPRSERRSHD